LSVSHHHAFDKLFVMLAHSRTIFPGGFFADGWGDMNIASSLGSDLANLKQDAIDTSSVKFELSDPASYDGVTVQHGSFESPLSARLPTESKRAYFQIVMPEDQTFPSKALPMAVVLPATGEHGFARQRTCLCMPLAKNFGIGSIILEGPFYGRRRPANMRGSKLRAVSDLPTLGLATIAEARVLLEWLKETEHGPLAICGGSMGGLHSMMTASVVPYPLGAVSWVGPPSAAPIFSRGLLGTSVNWPKLGEAEVLSRLLQTLPAQVIPAGLEVEALVARMSDISQAEREELARVLLEGYMSVTSILEFSPPVRPDACIFTVAESDLYMDLHVGWAEYWHELLHKWEGATVTDIPGGHVTASVFEYEKYQAAVAKAIDTVRQ
jgi:hypothetical protein